MSSKLSPKELQKRIQTAQAHLKAGDPAEAEFMLRKVLELRPRHAPALASLALARAWLGQFDDSLALIAKAVKSAPKDPQIHRTLGTIRFGLGDFDGAVDAFDAALRLDHRDPAALVGKARVLERRGQNEEATKLLDRAERHDPASPAAEALRLKIMNADRSIDPAQVEEAAEALLARGEAPTLVRRSILFLLGRNADRNGEYDRAFEILSEANALGRNPWDEHVAAGLYASIRRTFSSARLESLPRATIDTHQPIFIVGLPRSGSTLLETMLDAHPRIHGAGELPFMAQVIARVGELTQLAYPDGWTRLTPDHLDTIAAHYLRVTRNAADDAGAKEATHVVDKALENVMHLGAMTLAFPEATIVHVARNRVDAGLSIWMQDLIPSLHPYSADLADCGKQVRLVEKHLAHWYETLGDRIISVRYEDMVADPEPALRAILERAGLDFDPACLRPHERKRDVATASYDQVSKPLNTKAVGRAERYRPHLQPLIDALGPDPEASTSGD